MTNADIGTYYCNAIKHPHKLKQLIIVIIISSSSSRKNSSSTLGQSSNRSPKKYDFIFVVQYFGMTVGGGYVGIGYLYSQTNEQASRRTDELMDEFCISQTTLMGSHPECT